MRKLSAWSAVLAICSGMSIFLLYGTRRVPTTIRFSVHRYNCVSPCDVCCALDTEKRIAGFFAPTVHCFGDGTGNLKHLVAFGAFKPCCPCCHWFYLLCIRLANKVKQLTLHVEQDVNIDGAVEPFDSRSDLLKGAFDSRTRDPSFKNKKCVFDFCVLHEFRDGFIMEDIPAGF